MIGAINNKMLIIEDADALSRKERHGGAKLGVVSEMQSAVWVSLQQ
jgi:hypothetical protein